MRLCKPAILASCLILAGSLSSCGTNPSDEGSPVARANPQFRFGEQSDGAPSSELAGGTGSAASTATAAASPVTAPAASAPAVAQAELPSPDQAAPNPSVSKKPAQSASSANADWAKAEVTPAPTAKIAADLPPLASPAAAKPEASPAGPEAGASVMASDNAVAPDTAVPDKPSEANQSDVDTAAAAQAVPAAGAGAGADAHYTLNPGDKLHISVWGEQALQQDVVVAPDGTVSFPLSGQVMASGRTTEQLRSALAAKLKKFIPDPVVTVAMLDAAGNTFYVIGAVNHPGAYHSPQPVTVVQALSMAGGFTPFASKRSIKILHQEPGRTVSLPFNYNAVADGKNLDTNITLGSGDVVVVPD